MPPQETSSSLGSFTAGQVLFLVDARGVILAAGGDMTWLGVPADKLPGEQVAALFSFEVVSSDPEMLQAQWEAVVAAGSVELSLNTGDDAERKVSVSIVNGSGMDSCSFVVLSEVKAKPSAGQTGSVPSESEPFQTVLGAESVLAFFDLNFKEATARYSRPWKRMLGYVEAELVDSYDTWLELLHPEDSAAAPDKAGRKPGPPGLQSFSLEYRMRHREGHWVWLLCVGVRVFGKDSQLERVSGLHLDITDRKELEEAGILSEERLQALCDTGPLGAFDFDFHLGLAWLSPALKRRLGYEARELPDTAETFLHLLAEEVEGIDLPYWFASQGSGTVEELSCPISLRHKDGTVLSLHLLASRRYNRKRELLGVCGACLALPDTGPATAAAPSSSTPFEEALSEVSEGVLLVDVEGRLQHANTAAARLLGRSSTELVGTPLGEAFRLIHRESGKPVHADPCEQALAAEGSLPLNSQNALLRALETEPALPIVWTARALYSPEGKPEGVVIVFRNPEEMNLTPEELVKANRHETLALLAGGIAHDFNNLLTTILGGVSLAKDSRNPSALDDSEKACLEAKSLTRQLLAFAKGGAGVKNVVPAVDILRDAVKIAASGATAELSITADEGLPPIQVDRTQIIQVFQNLIVNALQAMPPAPHKAAIALRLSQQSLSADEFPPLPAGNYLRFEIQDNGVGIPPHILEKIWDPFFTTKKHGTGLGLATVLSIVRKHGGQIGVESEPGNGTRFTVFLPAATAPIEVQARRAASLRYGTGRILFMDDDPRITSLTAGMLESLEYKFDLAKNGEEAVKLYRSYFNINRPYDVVIMDLTVIGGMGGEEAFRLMKDLDPEVRAIAASGYDNEDMAKRCLDMGFCGYLTKPYRVTDLGKVIKTVIG